VNDRIKELADQCWNTHIDGVLVDGGLHFDHRKFADKIIDECITIIKDSHLPDPIMEPVTYIHLFHYRLLLYSVAEKIKQNFQVEK